jgi:hypothetical protein
MKIKIKETGKYYELVLRNNKGEDITAKMLASFADSGLDGDTMTKDTFNWWVVRLNELQPIIYETSKRGRNDISDNLCSSEGIIEYAVGGDN